MVALNDWINALQSSILERCDVMGDMIKESGLDRRVRLEIYQNAYLLRLAEALQANYPCLHKRLGENDFGRMMLAYIYFDMPQSASIRWFGASLSDFLETHQPYRLSPVLCEIARFEWALRHTVDAADSPRCTFDELASLDANDWINLRIGLHPSVTLQTHDWNAVAIVNATILDNPMPVPLIESSHWLIYRCKEGAGVWRSVDQLEWTALKATCAGIKFPDLCESIAECEIDVAEVAAVAAKHLRQWVDEGIVIFG